MVRPNVLNNMEKMLGDNLAEIVRRNPDSALAERLLIRLVGIETCIAKDRPDKAADQFWPIPLTVCRRDCND